MANDFERPQRPGAPPGDGDASGRPQADPRVSRRAVMRAAALGTVATGVYVGLSSVPAYASSSTGNDSSDTITINSTTSQATPGPFCLVKCCVTCWNTQGIYTQCAASTCTCGTHKTCGTQSTDKLTGNLQVPKLVGPAINLAYELWGPTDTAGCGSESPYMKLTTSNIGTHQVCEVSVEVTCSSGTPGSPYNGTNPQTVSGITSNGTVSITAPSCTGSLVGGPPNEARCPAAASVKITFSCVFN